MEKYSCKTFTQNPHKGHETIVKETSKTNDGAIKIDTTSQKYSNTMDYTKKTREELIAICKEKSIKGYSGCLLYTSPSPRDS